MMRNRNGEGGQQLRGIVKENCGDVYIFAVGPYSYRKTRRGVGIAIEI